MTAGSTYDEVNRELAARALQYATPATIPYVQHSQYLADALARMGEQGGQNIRTGGALASNLLAEALLQYGSRRANAQLLAREQADQAAMAQRAMIGLPDPTQPPAATPSVGGPQPGVSATPSASAPPAAATGATDPNAHLADALTTASQTAGGPVAPPDWDAIGKSHDMLVRTIIGEAGGNDAGQRAVASTILNRMNAGHLSPDQVIGEKGQFEPYGNKATWARLQAIPTDSPAYQQAAANADQVFTNGPTTNADHFWSPSAQAALGRRPPAWAVGGGQMIGGNQFSQLGYTPSAAVPPMIQSAGFPQSGQQGTQLAQGGPVNAGPPTPRPLQQTTGPDPSIPAPPIGGVADRSYQVASNGPVAAPSGGQLPAPAPPQQPPAPTNIQPPHGMPPTQDEWNWVQMMLRSGNPAQVQQGLAKAAELQSRWRTPPDADKPVWNSATGQYERQPGMSFRQVQGASPSDSAQIGPDGRVYHEAIPGVQGPLGSNQVYSGGQVKTLPVQQQPTFKIPGANGIFVNGPDGRPVKVADDSFTPKDLGDRLTKLQGSDQYKLADTATNMYNAAVQASQRPGGISDVELRDFAARQFSGGVARQFNVEALNHAQGVWANLKQFIPELMSGQKMSPAARAAVLQAMHDDAVQAQTSFKSLAQSDEAFANSQGMSLTPYLTPLTRPLPDLPDMGSIPDGATIPGTPPPAQQHGLPPGAPPGTRQRGDGRYFFQQGGQGQSDVLAAALQQADPTGALGSEWNTTQNILGATGMRERPGSLTAFNKADTDALSLAPFTVRSIGNLVDPLEWGQHLNKLLGARFFERASNEASALLQDPDTEAAIARALAARSNPQQTAAQAFLPGLLQLQDQTQ
ncbi:cell wall hydrolase [Caulobacter sp. KR2-114]|uniref:cell wall hydrolase n=1 Tax=Caulobacter sp. KR2-114 TaxID=3400912 RepID=UPI003C049AAB